MSHIYPKMTLMVLAEQWSFHLPESYFYLHVIDLLGGGGQDFSILLMFLLYVAIFSILFVIPSTLFPFDVFPFRFFHLKVLVRSTVLVRVV